MRRRFVPVLFGVLVFFCVSGLFFTTMAATQTTSDVYNNPAVNGPGEPSYWIDRGALFATYGNYPAAIKAYQKAMELDPLISSIFFNLSLAFTEIGDTDQAMAHINKAIMMDPDNHRYYYARARVLLISGQSERARQDFNKAADMGDPDAKQYLEK